MHQTSGSLVRSGDESAVLLQKIIQLETDLAEARSRDYKVIAENFCNEAYLLSVDIATAVQWVYTLGKRVRQQVNRKHNGDDLRNLSLTE